MCCTHHAAIRAEIQGYFCAQPLKPLLKRYPLDSATIHFDASCAPHRCAFPVTFVFAGNQPLYNPDFAAKALQLHRTAMKSCAPIL
jgi:hypothetical protein